MREPSKRWVYERGAWGLQAFNLRAFVRGATWGIWRHSMDGGWLVVNGTLKDDEVAEVGMLLAEDALVAELQRAIENIRPAA